MPINAKRVDPATVVKPSTGYSSIFPDTTGKWVAVAPDGTVTDLAGQGNPGVAATIEIASVDTGTPGAQGSVTNIGTATAAKLKFVLPVAAPAANTGGGTTTNVTYQVTNVTYFKVPGAQQWVPPSDFLSLDLVEGWAGSGSVAYGSSSGASGSAWGKKILSAAVGVAINLFVGAGGAKATSAAPLGADGTDTWWKSNTDFLIKAGRAGVRNGTAFVLGGQASACIADVAYDGGRGAPSNGSSDGGGGGGAAGPNGPGKDGTTGGKTAGAGVGGDSGNGAKGGLRNASSTVVATNGADSVDGGAGGGANSDDSGGNFDYAGNGGFPGGGPGGGQYLKGGGNSAGGQIRITWKSGGTVPSPGKATFYLGINGGVNNEVAQIFTAGENFVLLAGLPGSSGVFDKPATAQTVYTLYKNDIAFAALTIAAGSKTGYMSMSKDNKVYQGDVIKLVGPATADATLATGTLTLIGNLV